jgi:hypothetical protein
MFVAEHEHVGPLPKSRPSIVAADDWMLCDASARRHRTRRVPGEQTLPVGRGLPSLKPPRNCTSIEIGKSWSRSIVSGGCECTMTPLLRAAQAGASGACVARKRYSMRRR